MQKYVLHKIFLFGVSYSAYEITPHPVVVYALDGWRQGVALVCIAVSW